MLQITIDMFSGRPNPTWMVEADEAMELLEEISQSQPAIAAIHEGYQGLGYRGLVVETLSDNIARRYDLPASFRIAHNGHEKGMKIAERVLSSMLRAQLLDEGLHGLIIEELRRLRSREEIAEADAFAAPVAPIIREAVTCWIELGHFNPGFWNDPAHIGRNNCYHYASNHRRDTFHVQPGGGQPGAGCGHMYTALTCSAVTKAALCDGLHHRFDCFPESEKPRWLMALVVAPGYDFHWYRKQKEGFWGHKPGSTPARNVDNNGAIVWNPETAARLPYTDFCGYFYACRSQKII